MPHWVGMMWMVLDVASCGALLYPGAGSWNAETCGHSDSDRSQKTVGMLLLAPPSMYTYTSLQCQKPSFVSLIPTYLLCCRSYRCELWMFPTSSHNAYKSYYRFVALLFSRLNSHHSVVTAVFHQGCQQEGWCFKTESWYARALLVFKYSRKSFR